MSRIFPYSAVPVTSGMVYPSIYVGDGATFVHQEVLGVVDATTLTTDAIWRLAFWMPPTLPSGTCKLQVMALADATTGNLIINPKWASVAAEEDSSSATLNAEGDTTISWGANDDDEYKFAEITLDADTPVGDEIICMDLTIVNTGTTLAVHSGLIVSIIFE